MLLHERCPLRLTLIQLFMLLAALTIQSTARSPYSSEVNLLVSDVSEDSYFQAIPTLLPNESHSTTVHISCYPHTQVDSKELAFIMHLREVKSCSEFQFTSSIKNEPICASLIYSSNQYCDYPIMVCQSFDIQVNVTCSKSSQSPCNLQILFAIHQPIPLFSEKESLDENADSERVMRLGSHFARFRISSEEQSIQRNRRRFAIQLMPLDYLSKRVFLSDYQDYLSLCMSYKLYDEINLVFIEFLCDEPLIFEFIIISSKRLKGLSFLTAIDIIEIPANIDLLNFTLPTSKQSPRIGIFSSESINLQFKVDSTNYSEFIEFPERSLISITAESDLMIHNLNNKRILIFQFKDTNYLFNEYAFVLLSIIPPLSFSKDTLFHSQKFMKCFEFNPIDISVYSFEYVNLTDSIEELSQAKNIHQLYSSKNIHNIDSIPWGNNILKCIDPLNQERAATANTLFTASNTYHNQKKSMKVFYKFSYDSMKSVFKDSNILFYQGANFLHKFFNNSPDTTINRNRISNRAVAIKIELFSPTTQSQIELHLLSNQGKDTKHRLLDSQNSCQMISDLSELDSIYMISKQDVQHVKIALILKIDPNEVKERMLAKTEVSYESVFKQEQLKTPREFRLIMRLFIPRGIRGNEFRMQLKEFNGFMESCVIVIDKQGNQMVIQTASKILGIKLNQSKIDWMIEQNIHDFYWVVSHSDLDIVQIFTETKSGNVMMLPFVQQPALAVFEIPEEHRNHFMYAIAHSNLTLFSQEHWNDLNPIENLNPNDAKRTYSMREVEVKNEYQDLFVYVIKRAISDSNRQINSKITLAVSRTDSEVILVFGHLRMNNMIIQSLNLNKIIPEKTSLPYIFCNMKEYIQNEISYYLFQPTYISRISSFDSNSPKTEIENQNKIFFNKIDEISDYFHEKRVPLLETSEVTLRTQECAYFYPSPEILKINVTHTYQIDATNSDYEIELSFFELDSRFRFEGTRVVEISQSSLKPIALKLNSIIKSQKKTQSFISVDLLTISAYQPRESFEFQDLWRVTIRFQSAKVTMATQGIPVRFNNEFRFQFAFFTLKSHQHFYTIVFEDDSLLNQQSVEENQPQPMLQYWYVENIGSFKLLELNENEVTKKLLVYGQNNPIQAAPNHYLVISRYQDTSQAHSPENPSQNNKELSFSIIPDNPITLVTQNSLNVSLLRVNKNHRHHILIFDQKYAGSFLRIVFTPKPLSMLEYPIYKIPCLYEIQKDTLRYKFNIRDQNSKEQIIFIHPRMTISQQELSEMKFRWMDNNNHICIWLQSSNWLPQISIVEKPELKYTMQPNQVMKLEMMMDLQGSNEDYDKTDTFRLIRILTLNPDLEVHYFILINEEITITETNSLGKIRFYSKNQRDSIEQNVQSASRFQQFSIKEDTFEFTLDEQATTPFHEHSRQSFLCVILEYPITAFIEAIKVKKITSDDSILVYIWPNSTAYITIEDPITVTFMKNYSPMTPFKQYRNRVFIRKSRWIQLNIKELHQRDNQSGSEISERIILVLQIQGANSATLSVEQLDFNSKQIISSPTEPIKSSNQEDQNNSGEQESNNEPSEQLAEEYIKVNWLIGRQRQMKLLFTDRLFKKEYLSTPSYSLFPSSQKGIMIVSDDISTLSSLKNQMQNGFNFLQNQVKETKVFYVEGILKQSSEDPTSFTFNFNKTFLGIDSLSYFCQILQLENTKNSTQEVMTKQFYYPITEVFLLEKSQFEEEESVVEQNFGYFLILLLILIIGIVICIKIRSKFMKFYSKRSFY